MMRTFAGSQWKYLQIHEPPIFDDSFGASKRGNGFGNTTAALWIVTPSRLAEQSQLFQCQDILLVCVSAVGKGGEDIGELGDVVVCQKRQPHSVPERNGRNRWQYRRQGRCRRWKGARIGWIAVGVGRGALLLRVHRIIGIGVFRMWHRIKIRLRIRLSGSSRAVPLDLVSLYLTGQLRSVLQEELMVVAPLVKPVAQTLKPVHVELTLETRPLGLTEPQTKDLINKLLLVVDHEASVEGGRIQRKE
jgi:hypothetical protein